MKHAVPLLVKVVRNDGDEKIVSGGRYDVEKEILILGEGLPPLSLTGTIKTAAQDDPTCDESGDR